MVEITCIGINEVQVVDRETNAFGSTYIICKVLKPTFDDRPFMTICEDVMEDGNITRYGGHYDMNLMDAVDDFYRRLGYRDMGRINYTRDASQDEEIDKDGVE